MTQEIVRELVDGEWVTRVAAQGAGGPVTAADIDSQAASNGDVLTADGTGGADWQPNGGSRPVETFPFTLADMSSSEGFSNYLETLTLNDGDVLLAATIDITEVWDDSAEDGWQLVACNADPVTETTRPVTDPIHYFTASRGRGWYQRDAFRRERRGGDAAHSADHLPLLHPCDGRADQAVRLRPLQRRWTDWRRCRKSRHHQGLVAGTRSRVSAK